MTVCIAGCIIIIADTQKGAHHVQWLHLAVITNSSTGIRMQKFNLRLSLCNEMKRFYIQKYL